MGGERQVLSQRALGRALLERQMLLGRSERSVPAALEHLVGMQAQAPNPPYIGLWTRLAGFRPDDLSRLITGREVVRIALMRSTIHLVTARDCRALRPVVAASLERAFYTASPFGRRLAAADRAVDVGAVVAAGRELVEAEPMTLAQLRVALGERWPDGDNEAMAQAVRSLAPLVQVPPRGVWGVGGVARCTTAEAWLRAPLGTDVLPEPMLTRYLAAFGPASVADMATWSGLRGLAEVVDRMRPNLRVFADESGRELFDLPDAPRPDPDTPAPARFVPDFDNLTLAHADRTRVISDEARRRLMPGSVVRATVLLDGRVAGFWKIVRSGKATTLVVEPLARLGDDDAADLEREGLDLLAFAAEKATTRAVRFEPAS